MSFTIMYTIGIFFICISNTLTCTLPENSVGIVIDDGAVGTNLDAIMFPMAKCDCDHGTKYFYKPLLMNETEDEKMWYFYYNRKMIFSIDTDYWTNGCLDMCLCTENGICYYRNDSHVSMDVFPLCFNGSCHVFGCLDGGYMVSEQGGVLEPVEPENITDAIPYCLKLSSISCSGCPSRVRNAKCMGNLETPQDGNVIQRYDSFFISHNF